MSPKNTEPNKESDEGPDFTPRPALFSKENLWVNGPLLFVIVCAAITGTAAWLDVRAEIRAMRVAMENQNAQGWRVGHEQQVLYQLSRDNPMLKVPDAYDIHSRIK